VALLLALVVATAVASPIVLAGLGVWDGPELSELDLGASGAGAANGRWRVTEVVDGGDAVPLADGSPIRLRIDTVRAELRGDAGCNPLLGSFTLRPDGAASFTVPDPDAVPCNPEVQRRDQAVRQVLAGTARWAVDGDRLTLSGPVGHLTLEATDPGAS
jgi:heat shock protein HslJ